MVSQTDGTAPKVLAGLMFKESATDVTLWKLTGSTLNQVVGTICNPKVDSTINNLGGTRGF